MASDLAHVEQAGQYIVAVGRAELGGFQASQATGSGSTELGEGWHDLACSGMAFQHPVDFPIDATVDGVDQAVPSAVTGMLQEGGGEDPFAAWCEDKLHGVIHATGHDGVHFGTVWAHTINVRSAIIDNLPARPLMLLLLEGALAPVNPAVQSEIRPVQVIGAAVGRLAVEPLCALVRAPIAIGILQSRNAPELRHDLAFGWQERVAKAFHNEHVTLGVKTHRNGIAQLRLRGY